VVPGSLLCQHVHDVKIMARFPQLNQLSTFLAIIEKNHAWYECIKLEARLNGVIFGRCKISEVPTSSAIISTPSPSKRLVILSKGK
jgi:hypothetical protein